MNDCWSPEPIFAGRTVFILGGGPSVGKVDMDALRPFGIIAVNLSWLLCPWADLVYLTDAHLFRQYRDRLLALPGMIVTTSRSAKEDAPDRVTRIKTETRPDFPMGESIVRWGRSSGHIGVGVAVACQARRVVLVGFEMGTVDGREHHHDEYEGPRDLAIYEKEFLPGFRGWHEAARRAGCEIFNATPESALTEFPRVDLKEALTWTAS